MKPNIGRALRRCKNRTEIVKLGATTRNTTRTAHPKIPNKKKSKKRSAKTLIEQMYKEYQQTDVAQANITAITRNGTQVYCTRNRQNN